MTERKGLKFSKNDQEALQHLSDVLHLFHHRNKNQHRRSIWWRHFSVFRRQLNKLLEEVNSLNEVPQTHLERIRKKTRDQETSSNISERLDLWQNVLVTKWQNSFSQIIADGRFAVLGLVLIAVLAQTCQITGITTKLEDIGQDEVEKVLKRFGEEDWEAESEVERGRTADGEDIGVAILRDAHQNEDRKGENLPAVLPKNDTDSASQSGISTRASKPAKKKRKRGDAIDDLFSNLG